ncbi:helix-turn-helix domain-containing protein [Mycobacteroides chelonae]|uniref:helix-turn-helix domain-containing protein n=1 Tax=Mycobacteroides chelonae TaxID=1774 RepID=UPI001F3C3B88|nr:helix-turn-helix transcriptional regulator [Mycobacteroides chelonae]
MTLVWSLAAADSRDGPARRHLCRGKPLQHGHVGDEQQWTPKRVTTADVAAGAVLRRVRERAGLTLDQAAEASRISKAVLSRTERGERPARVTELLPLAAAYDMTAAELAAAIAADPAVQAAAME